jgi:hypothetical protein
MVALELLGGERKTGEWWRDAGEWRSVARREILRG